MRRTSCCWTTAGWPRTARSNEISLHPQLRAIVGPEAVGAVLIGAIEAADAATGLATLRIGANVLRVALRGAQVGAHVRVQLFARDIILATSRPEGLSVRNELAGTIARVTPDDEDTDLVHIDVGDAAVLARVTRAATAALQLKPGLPVWALVKAASIRGHAFVAGN